MENKIECEVQEIKIRPLKLLSFVAQNEVAQKLKNLPEDYGFKGYVKVSYGLGSPLKVLSVDPIKGTVLDYFKDITKFVN